MDAKILKVLLYDWSMTHLRVVCQNISHIQARAMKLFTITEHFNPPLHIAIIADNSFMHVVLF